jgi:hypothetical protein
MMTSVTLLNEAERVTSNLNKTRGLCARSHLPTGPTGPQYHWAGTLFAMPNS